MDEPFYLAIARRILEDPWQPLAFSYNWYGETVPMAFLNNAPPLLAYLLAAALKVSGGSEWATRLPFLAFDALAGASLYLLAARFLRRPLWPVLAAVVCPAWLVNMNHIMTEKPALALGLAGLYAWTRGADEDDARLSAAGTALLCAAGFFKYAAIGFAAPALAYVLGLGWTRRRAALMLAPAAAALAVPLLSGGGGASLHSAARVMAQAHALWPSQWPHVARSVLSFIGGLSVVALLWPFVAAGLSRRTIAAAAAATAVLFLPVFDLEAVRWVDRLSGAAFSFAALCALAGSLAGEPRHRARPMLLAWVLAFGAVQVFFYWAVLARLILFVIPPLILLLASGLEARLDDRALGRAYAAGVLAAAAAALALAAVDYRYAGVQREFAMDQGRALRAGGRAVWFSGHWGFQHYMEAEGARPLDARRGAWAQVASGDAAVVPYVNMARMMPSERFPASITVVRYRCALPLRLLSGWTGQGGFYSNGWGFLPYSLSRELLDEFAIVEKL